MNFKDVASQAILRSEALIALSAPILLGEICFDSGLVHHHVFTEIRRITKLLIAEATSMSLALSMRMFMTDKLLVRRQLVLAETAHIRTECGFDSMALQVDRVCEGVVKLHAARLTSICLLVAMCQHVLLVHQRIYAREIAQGTLELL